MAPRSLHLRVWSWTATFSLDGLLRASLAATGNINATSDGLLDIGGLSTGTGNFVGQLDEVRVYPNALSAAQAFQRYIETKDGLTASNTIVPQETTVGDNWVCQVTPNDAWTDGTPQTSNTLNVVAGNGMPHIDWYSPSSNAPAVDQGASLDFNQTSSDPNGDALSYSWALDNIVQATTQNWTYTTSTIGQHTVRVTATDTGALSDYQEWTVNVLPPPIYVDLTINAATHGTTNPAPGTYPYGEGLDASVQAIPDTGYVLDHWILDGSNYGSANPAVVTMTAAKTLEPVFIDAPQYTLHVDISGSGVTNPTGDTMYYEGTQVSVSASAETGYSFSHWLLNDVNVGDANPYSLVMTGDCNLIAVFVPATYTLTVDTVSGGSVTKNPDQTILRLQRFS